MEKSTVLKLRQAESNDIVTNGSFKTTIAGQGIILEEGDVVKLHTIILDTAAEAVIRLNEDTELSMTTIKYLRNIELSANLMINQLAYTLNPPSVVSPDLKNYFSCAAIQTGNDDYRVTSCAIAPLHYGKKEFGGIYLKFDFFDVDGQPAPGGGQSYHMLPQKTRKHLSKPFEFPINRLVQGKFFLCVNEPQDFINANIQPIGTSNITFVGPVDTGTKTLLPVQETIKFIVKEGTYTPAEIGQIVTDNMSSYNSSGPTGNNYAGGAFSVNNPFMSTIGRDNYRVKNAPTGVASNDYYLIPESFLQDDGTRVMTNIMEFIDNVDPIPADPSTLPTSIANDRIIGANQTSLNFDNNLKKMNFDLLHTPYFISPAGGGGGDYVPGIVYPVGNGSSGSAIPKQPQQAHSGIAFTHLGSREVVGYIFFKTVDNKQVRIVPPTPIYGRTTTFWNDIGFDDIIVPITHDGTELTLNNGDKVLSCQVTVDYGKNITGTFLGNDVVVKKSATWALPQQVDTITSLTTPIIANRVFDQVANDEGYYLVEIGVKIPQKMLGGTAIDTDIATSSNKVQAIMGKYFTSGNFLQDTGAAGIVYQHVGEPQMLNDLNVRVLHADGTPPGKKELGPKNSIFIEVIKQVKPPVMPIEKSK